MIYPAFPVELVALLDLLGLDFFELFAQCRRQRVDHLNVASIQFAEMKRVLALGRIDMAEPARQPLLKFAHPAIQPLQPGRQLAHMLLIGFRQRHHLVILLVAHFLKPLLVHQEALGRNALDAFDLAVDLRQLGFNPGDLSRQLLGEQRDMLANLVEARDPAVVVIQN